MAWFIRKTWSHAASTCQSSHSPEKLKQLDQQSIKAFDIKVLFFFHLFEAVFRFIWRVGQQPKIISGGGFKAYLASLNCNLIIFDYDISETHRVQHLLIAAKP